MTSVRMFTNNDPSQHRNNPQRQKSRRHLMTTSHIHSGRDGLPPPKNMTITRLTNGGNRCQRIGLFIGVTALFGVCLLDLILCPHSKVEESFNLQATHDIFYHGLTPAVLAQYNNYFRGGQDDEILLPYDHLQYPGVVPRTFAGPILLAYACRFLLWPCSVMNIAVNPMVVQFLARFLLLLIHVFGWIRLAQAVDQKVEIHQSNSYFTTGAWLLIITACQFHIPFYSSRMLPNILALAIVLHCYSYWLEGGKQKNINVAASLLVAATTIFRCDLLLLLGSMGISWLISRQLTIVGALKIGALTGMVALALTVPLDSLLWQRPLWPEGEVFYFNTILGKSKEWGTSPWHWYFSSALPKSMLLTILLVPFSLTRLMEHAVSWEYNYRRRKQLSSSNGSKDTPTHRANIYYLIDMTWLPFLAPILGFVSLYSFLGHKEMRFIFPSMPILNLGAAAGMSKLTRLAFFPSRDKKDDASKPPFSWVALSGFAVGLMCLFASLCGSLIFVAVSKSNYPGGDALLKLTSHIQVLSSTDADLAVNVHIDVASAMSGVSLFGQRAAQAATPTVDWDFRKDGYEEGHSVGRLGLESFTHLLSEDPSDLDGFETIAAIQGKPRLSIRDRGIVTENAIYVLERANWRKSLQQRRG